MNTFKCLQIHYLPKQLISTSLCFPHCVKSKNNIQFSSVELLSCVRLFVTPWTAAHQPCLSITNSWSLLKLMSIKLVMPSNLPILYCSLLLLPSIFPSIKGFSNESALHTSSVQSLSCVRLFATPWTAARQASLSITNCRSPPKPMPVESVLPSNHLLLRCPLLLLPSIFPSIRVLSNESALRIRWPNYCSFSFNISPSKEHPGLISFRMDWLDLLAIQGSLKNLLQHHSSKASILWLSAVFIVKLSHPYMTTGKTIVLTGGSLLAK